jgi:hypothetical protein
MEKTGSSSGKEFSIWKAVGFSFFSMALYRDVRKKWNGVGFAYLFFLLVLLWIPRIIGLHTSLVSKAAKELPNLVKDVPTIKIEKGIVSVDVKQPYFLPNKEAPVLIIDTTGHITSLKQLPSVDKEAAVLVTRSSLVVLQGRHYGAEERSYDLSAIDSLVINREKLTRWGEDFSHWLSPVLYPFCVVGHFIFNIVAMIVYGLIGLLIAKILGLSLEYETSMRLAAISHTPALILRMVLALFDVVLPWSFLTFLVISTSYLFFAIKANAGASQPPLPT